MVASWLGCVLVVREFYIPRLFWRSPQNACCLAVMYISAAGKSLKVRRTCGENILVLFRLCECHRHQQREMGIQVKSAEAVKSWKAHCVWGWWEMASRIPHGKFRWWWPWWPGHLIWWPARHVASAEIWIHHQQNYENILFLNKGNRLKHHKGPFIKS